MNIDLICEIIALVLTPFIFAFAFKGVADFINERKEKKNANKKDC